MVKSVLIGMNKKSIILILLATSIVSFRVLTGCRKTMHTRGLTSVAQLVPPHFPPPRYNYSDNPLTKEGIELGRQIGRAHV